MSLDKKVLIVEDDFFIREMYERALKLQGFEVFAADDGKQGIDLFDQEEPDLVLLDLMLPDISGMDVLRHIKEVNSTVPVVMLSNVDTEEIVNEAMALGAHSYKVKAQTSPIAVSQEVVKILG